MRCAEVLLRVLCMPCMLCCAGLLGLEEFERQLKEALRAGFEARAAAYAEEVRGGGWGEAGSQCW